MAIYAISYVVSATGSCSGVSSSVGLADKGLDWYRQGWLLCMLKNNSIYCFFSLLALFGGSLEAAENPFALSDLAEAWGLVSPIT
jgi:hypothetical protein